MVLVGSEGLTSYRDGDNTTWITSPLKPFIKLDLRLTKSTGTLAVRYSVRLLIEDAATDPVKVVL